MKNLLYEKVRNLSEKYDLLNRYYIGLIVFFSIGTAIGRFYQKMSKSGIYNWKHYSIYSIVIETAFFIFVYAVVLSIFVYIYKRCNLGRRDASNYIEKVLFNEHTFIAPLFVIVLCGIPILIHFYPGTLQWDAHAQLWQYLGVIEWNGHHPMAVTWLMGKCLSIGRALFGTDAGGIFLYTFPQYVIQCLTFAYSIYIISRINSPMLLRWTSLLYFSIFPIFRIWGYTFVKDTGYYIAFLLFITILVDVYTTEKDSNRLMWKKVFLYVPAVGITLMRNEGKYIILFMFVASILCQKRNWKWYGIGIILVLLSVVGVEKIWMPAWDISEGEKKEMLSIPMQQTARYLLMYGEDVTDEERKLLEEIFQGTISNVVQAYNPEVADPVKELFLDYPTDEQLHNYFKVWCHQFVRHPDAYVDAFFNHTYGYFYLGKENFFGKTGNYYIGNSEHWDDGYLDISFLKKDNSGRKFYEKVAQFWENTPIISLMYRASFYIYIICMELAVMLSKRKRIECIVLLPFFCTAIICLLSPVNAYIRYMLPIMVTLPIGIGWTEYNVRFDSFEGLLEQK